MAESTLSLAYSDFATEVAALTGSDAASAETVRIINRGYRQFLYPPPLVKGGTSHVWSFLSPTATKDTIIEYSTGTITIVNDTTTVTLAGGGTWPSWVAADATITIDSVNYGIASRTNDTVIVLDTEWALTGIAGESYTIHYHPEDYDLDDQFGSLAGDITYDDGAQNQPVSVVGEGQIMAWRARFPSRTGLPKNVAVRAKAIPTGTSDGQRFELLVWPQPNDDYTLNYRYNVQVNKIDGTNNYPVGGMQHGETILASCLDVAERSAGHTSGVEHGNFMTRLAASIALDSQTMAPKTLGYGGGKSGGSWGQRPAGYTTYNDTLY